MEFIIFPDKSSIFVSAVIYQFAEGAMDPEEHRRDAGPAPGGVGPSIHFSARGSSAIVREIRDMFILDMFVTD